MTGMESWLEGENFKWRRYMQLFGLEFERHIHGKVGKYILDGKPMKNCELNKKDPKFKHFCTQNPG